MFFRRKLLTPPVVPSEPATAPNIGIVSNPSLDDLSEIMPDVASSLREVLDYKGNVAEDLMLTFQVSFEEYGRVLTADLTSGERIQNLNPPWPHQQLDNSTNGQELKKLDCPSVQERALHVYQTRLGTAVIQNVWGFGFGSV